MPIETELVGDAAVIAINGSFDIASYDAFNQAYKRYLGSVSYFKIDLACTHYMDSSALGMLLLLKETAGDEVKIELINPSEEVAQVLQVAQFNQLFTIR